MKNQASRQPNPHESGSMIVWILIMIALFGALSFALSQGSRTGMSTVGKEQAKLAATEILEYSQKVKDGVKLVTIGNACKDTELSFENSVLVLNDGSPASPSSRYPNAPSDKRCHIFNPKGGGINPIVMTNALEVKPYVGGARSGNAIFQRAVVPQAGTSAGDLVMVIPQINKETCLAINQTLYNTSDIPYGGWPTTYYEDTYAGADPFDAAIASQTQQAGCFTNDAWAINTHFYKVLIAR